MTDGYRTYLDPTRPEDNEAEAQADMIERLRAVVDGYLFGNTPAEAAHQCARRAEYSPNPEQAKRWTKLARALEAIQPCDLGSYE